MSIYETTFILKPQSDDATLDRQVKQVTDLIGRYKGKVLKEDRWGVRRLAYPIEKFTQGYYTRIVFEGSSDLLPELDRHFRIEEPYIRHLTVLFEGRLEPKEEERGREGRRPERKPESSPKPEKTEEPKAEEAEKPAPEEAKAEGPEKEAEKAEAPAEVTEEPSGEEEKKTE